jgi:hypothetical protein
MKRVHFTVGRRMAAGLGIVLVVLSAVAATAYFALGRAGQGMRATADGAELAAQAMSLDLAMQDLLRTVSGFKASGAAEESAAFENEARRLHTAFATIATKAVDAEAAAAILQDYFDRHGQTALRP